MQLITLTELTINRDPINRIQLYIYFYLYSQDQLNFGNKSEQTKWHICFGRINATFTIFLFNRLAQYSRQVLGWFGGILSMLYVFFIDRSAQYLRLLN
jgi:hypothetical protein